MTCDMNFSSVPTNIHICSAQLDEVSDWNELCSGRFPTQAPSTEETTTVTTVMTMTVVTATGPLSTETTTPTTATASLSTETTTPTTAGSTATLTLTSSESPFGLLTSPPDTLAQEASAPLCDDEDVVLPVQSATEEANITAPRTKTRVTAAPTHHALLEPVATQDDDDGNAPAEDDDEAEPRG